MVTDGYWTYCRNINVEPLCCSLETHIILSINYTLIKKMDRLVLYWGLGGSAQRDWAVTAGRDGGSWNQT